METLSAVHRFKIVNRFVFICFHLLLCGVDYGEPNTSKICASFTFPTVEGDTLTARENETVVVPFGIANDTCGVSTDFTIRVVEDIFPPHPFCTLLREHGKCFKPLSEKNCDCNNTTGGYQLKKKFSRHDHTSWTWKETHGLIGSRSILFNITYPGSVISLTMTPAEDVLQQNSSVLVNCSWDEGNPPVSARLLDRHGVEMEGSIYSSGQIIYTFPAVGCQDAGLIHCEAPGASHNVTITLLVKCPPEFEKTKYWTFGTEENIATILNFPVRAHTTDITECLLVKIVDDTGKKIINCTSSAVLSGSPPDMNLTVEIDSIFFEEEQEDGKWMLILANEAGRGTVEFSLIGHTVREDVDVPRNDVDVLTIGLNVCGILLLVVIVVTVNIVCWQKERRINRLSPHLNDRNAVEEQQVRIELRSLSGGRRSTHLYEEVRDAAADSAPPPHHRQSPIVGSDGYLVPHSTTSVRGRYEGSRDGQRFSTAGGYMDMGQGRQTGGDM